MKQIIAKWSLGKELLPSSWWIPIFVSKLWIIKIARAINLRIELTEEPYLVSRF